WDRSFAAQDSNKAQHQTAVASAFQELRQWEDFFAYPGQKLLASLEDRISSGDATGAARLSQSIGNALLTRSYRANVGDWESDDESPVNFGERVPVVGDDAATHPPY